VRTSIDRDRISRPGAWLIAAADRDRVRNTGRIWIDVVRFAIHRDLFSQPSGSLRFRSRGHRRGNYHAVPGGGRAAVLSLLTELVLCRFIVGANVEAKRSPELATRRRGIGSTIRRARIEVDVVFAFGWRGSCTRSLRLRFVQPSGAKERNDLVGPRRCGVQFFTERLPRIAIAAESGDGLAGVDRRILCGTGSGTRSGV